MHDNWFVGKYVELQGNRVALDGCVFSVDSLSIPTRLKSRFALDQYEGAERYLVKRYLIPSLPVIELGAGAGVVSCIVNRRLDDPCHHIVVEPNPSLIPLLAANRDRNGLHFRIVNRAYAYGRQSVDLDLSRDFVTASVCTTSTRMVHVPATSLRQLIDAAGFDLCSLICDIEGSELDLLRHELPCLTKQVARFIVEFHSTVDTEDTVVGLIQQLHAAGFVQLEQCSRVRAFHNARY
jgi:FkbM family methyltransferase